MKLLETEDERRKNLLERAKTIFQVFSNGQLFFYSSKHDEDITVNYKFTTLPLFFWNEHSKKVSIMIELLNKEYAPTVEFTCNDANINDYISEKKKYAILLRNVFYQLKAKLYNFQIEVETDFPLQF